MSEKIVIREMTGGDCLTIAGAFDAQGWNKPASQYHRYWQEALEGRRVVLLAEYEGRLLVM